MDRTAVFLEQLSRYEPLDDLERANRRDFVRLLRSAPDPFSRGEFSPGHVTASLFIIDDHRRLLLHHHRRLGRWLQMGGHIKPGQTPLQAAIREGAEESGLRDLDAVLHPIDIDVHLIPAGRGEPDHRHYDVRYVARTRTPALAMMDAAESTELMWVDLNRAAELMASVESRRVIAKIAGVPCAS